MEANDTYGAGPALAEARKALVCLHLEVSPSVANDVAAKVEAAFQAQREEIQDAVIVAVMRRPRPVPEAGKLLKCMICALDRPWGVFDSTTGAAVCIYCRDKARS